MIFGKSTFVKRCEQLRKAMATQGLRGAVVTRTHQVIYFSGCVHFPSDRPYYFVLPANKDPVLLIPAMDMGHASRKTWVEDVRSWGPFDFPSPTPIPKILAETLRDLSMGDGKIGIDEKANSPIASALQSNLSGAELVYLGDAIAEMMSSKSKEEIELIRMNARYVDYAIEVAVKNAKLGANELDVQLYATAETSRKIVAEIPQVEMRTPPLQTVVGFGERAGYVHARWRPGRIVKGELGIINPMTHICDYVAVANRPVVAGDPTVEQTKLIQTVVEAEQAVFQAMRPGQVAAEIQDIAKTFLKKRGYDWYARAGYELGVLGRGNVFLIEGVNRPLKPNMTFRIFMGVFGRKDGGISCSDTVLVTEEGPEYLTRYPREILVVS